jgi:colanic acid biosynthesis glycosyl transferase WcaI
LSATQKQRVWVVSELYYPELISTGYFVTGIAEGLASTHPVSVLCGQPTYRSRGLRAPSRETLNGVDVHRCWGTTLDKDKLPFRLLNFITISLSIFFAALVGFRRGDIVITVTNPPLLPYLMFLVCRLKGARFVLLVHDVYPEVFTRLGMMKEGSLPVRLMEAGSRWLYNGSDRIVVLGRDMEALVLDKLKSRKERVVIATNWGDPDQVTPQPFSENPVIKKLDLTHSFVPQYCGNIGRTHGMSDVVDAAEAFLPESDVHFLVIGSGAKRPWVEEQKKQRNLNNLTVHDLLPRSELLHGLNASSISIISFSPGMSGISVPSRMYDVMAAGKPILAICDPQSELAAVVQEEKIGWVIGTGRVDLVVEALHEAKTNPELLRQMGERSRSAVVAKYTHAHIIRIYEAIITELSAKKQ